ncbi:unnamed protein product [Bursaphelenchus okinawaensis]|uniref:Uncharacterized protein n=1 Tax=Bursaphelenchus okinawaensis TaxID=465554 RepID=A0A811JX13_9BILA|nr:unnamed protein product [Bursaphelenchus okinawaensis]CAG9086735.1 unnamed protein product [Bursaphelenchus okinawaensis]
MDQPEFDKELLKNMPCSTNAFSNFDPNCRKKTRYIRVWNTPVTSRERKIVNERDDAILTALINNWNRKIQPSTSKDDIASRPGPSHRRHANDQPTSSSPPEAKQRRAS